MEKVKKIVLIGASGFVGSALLNEALNRGFEVTAVVRHPEKIKIENENLKVVKADVSALDVAEHVQALLLGVFAGHGVGVDACRTERLIHGDLRVEMKIRKKQYTNIFLKRKYSGRKRLKNCLLLRENLE